MKDLIEEIAATLAGDSADRRLAAVTVCSRKGSAPRTAGAKMIVREDGSIAGTVGGGLVEAEAIGVARGLLEAGASREARFCAFDLTGALGEGADLICGGTMDLLIELLDGQDRPLYEALAGALAAGRRGTLLTAFAPEGCEREERAGRVQPARIEARHLLLGAGEALGDPCPLEPSALRPLRRARFARLFEQERTLVLAEPHYVAGTIYLYGAGHVSRPVAAVGHLLGFRVEVYDDRAEFADRSRFPTADRLAVLSSFDRAFEGVTPDADSYVVIVTRGHSHDRTVLRQALRTEAGYVGMIGSRRKRDALYDSLRGEGVTDEQLARVHCPIGLPIEAETPEEIAVSIVAELVADRARRKS